MENSAPLIFEISSDEEAGFGETRHEVFDDGWDVEDHDWLSKLLAEVEANAVDFDEAMVVREAIPNPEESITLPLKPTAKIEDSDDDDCVILDGYPDKLLAVEDGRVNVDDSDDLVVIAEKGQVACRDFPHPRHICAKFPFASTPHGSRCDQCHCYVCDSIAPCSLWGTGISSLDHCHATEKEEFWRAQRKSLKKSDNVPPILPSVDNTSFSRELSQTTQVLSLTSLPPNYSLLNIINQGRSQSPGFSVPRNRFQPYLVAQQLQNTSNSNGTLSARNRSVWNSVPFLKSWPDSENPGLNNYSGSNQPTMGSRTSNTVYSRPGVSVPPNMGGFYSNYIPSQPQMSSQPYSSYLVRNSMPSLPFPASNLVTGLPSQSRVASQSNVGNNTENSSLPVPIGLSASWTCCTFADPSVQPTRHRQ